MLSSLSCATLLGYADIQQLSYGFVLQHCTHFIHTITLLTHLHVLSPWLVEHIFLSHWLVFVDFVGCVIPCLVRLITADLLWHVGICCADIVMCSKLSSNTMQKSWFNELFVGTQMTGTTDVEEELIGAGGMVPFSIEGKIRKYGGIFRQGTSDTRPFTMRSGNIVTGQNVASSLLTAEGLVEAMSLGVRLTPLA